ncbi:hypothetical protein F9D46_24925, partial [Salmonella enterica]|nr:hypothetical protein [Salmonella enterica]
NSSVKSTGESNCLIRLFKRSNDGGSSCFSRLLIVRKGWTIPPAEAEKTWYASIGNDELAA